MDDRHIRLSFLSSNATCCAVCAARTTQNVINQFKRIAQDQRVSFFGNVCVGKDVSVEELRSIYSLVRPAARSGNVCPGLPPHGDGHLQHVGWPNCAGCAGVWCRE